MLDWFRTVGVSGPPEVAQDLGAHVLLGASRPSLPGAGGRSFSAVPGRRHGEAPGGAVRTWLLLAWIFRLSLA